MNEVIKIRDRNNNTLPKNKAVSVNAYPAERSSEEDDQLIVTDTNNNRIDFYSINNDK